MSDKSAEEFHEKSGEASSKHLESPAVTPESVSRKLIEEGEKLMAQRRLVKRPPITLDSIIASITARFRRRGP